MAGSSLSQHQAVVAWLTKNIGQHEDPMGSNNGAFVRSCQRATWLKPPAPGKQGWPWCVATWVKAWTVAGRKLPYLGAGAYQMLDWYRKNLPGWVVPLERARPGAAVIFNIGAGHLAMLESCDLVRGTVTTVGGNESDMVKRTTRPVSLIRGIVDPPEHAPPPPVVARPPRFEVVTSDSGHRVIYVSGRKAIGNKLPLILKRNPRGVQIRPRK